MSGTGTGHVRTAESLAENPYAGQGPVLLDIGEETGGLIVHTGPDLLGAEIEILPGLDAVTVAAVAAASPGHSHSPGHGHAHGHAHPHGQAHTHAHEHAHPHGHSRHAEVLARPLPDGSTQPCAVYPDVEPGWYTLRVLPHGPSMTTRVHAGTVTTVAWSPDPRRPS